MIRKTHKDSEFTAFSHMMPYEGGDRQTLLLGLNSWAWVSFCLDRCPDLVLINGEDLTPYRAASKRIMALLGRFGTVERY